MPIVIASDPGKINFASAVVQVGMKGNAFRYRLLHATMLKDMLTKMTSPKLHDDIHRFRREYSALVRRYKPEHLVAERFMNRGAIGGVSGELVSAMLGIMGLQKCKTTTWITAAQWKNAFNRHSDLAYVYEEAPFLPHVVDALCIGIYKGCQIFGLKPFEFLDDKGTERLLDRMEVLDVALNGNY